MAIDLLESRVCNCLGAQLVLVCVVLLRQHQAFTKGIAMNRVNWTGFQPLRGRSCRGSFVGFSVVFFDFDNDTRLDLAIANGHIMDVTHPGVNGHGWC